MTDVSSEGKKLKKISMGGNITEFENKYYNDNFCLSVVEQRNCEQKYTETFREDFVKSVEFDNGDYLIMFPDSTKISFTKKTLTYRGTLFLKQFTFIC